jgi:hypothetical protein
LVLGLIKKSAFKPASQKYALTLADIKIFTYVSVVNVSFIAYYKHLLPTIFHSIIQRLKIYLKERRQKLVHKFARYSIVYLSTNLFSKNIRLCEKKRCDKTQRLTPPSSLDHSKFSEGNAIFRTHSDNNYMASYSYSQFVREIKPHFARDFN